MIDADATVAALTEQPERTALLVDFDGSLAPIVERADDARPLPDARRPCSPASRAGSAGSRSSAVGRSASWPEHLPVDGLVLVGLYGMEQSVDGAYTVDPRVRPYLDAVAAATAELEARLPGRARRTEVGHQRHAALAAGARTGRARSSRSRARSRRGTASPSSRTRMAIELRPPIDVDKARRDPRARRRVSTVAAFAGDDSGDLPAFAALAARGRRRPAAPGGAHRRALDRGAARARGRGRPGRRRARGLVALLARVADEIGEPVGG